MIGRAVLLALLALAACGRVGPIAPPGPRERVIYPRGYPAPDRVPRATVNDVAPPAAATPPR